MNFKVFSNTFQKVFGLSLLLHELHKFMYDYDYLRIIWKQKRLTICTKTDMINVTNALLITYFIVLIFHILFLILNGSDFWTSLCIVIIPICTKT